LIEHQNFRYLPHRQGFNFFLESEPKKKFKAGHPSAYAVLFLRAFSSLRRCGIGRSYFLTTLKTEVP